MPSYFESRKGRRRETLIAAAFLILALILYLLPDTYQAPIRRTVRVTVLRPFMGLQTAMADQDTRSIDVGAIQAQRDSLVAVLAAQAPIVEENRRLRALLGLEERAAPTFVPARLVRIGIAGGESTFLLNVGREQGIEPGAPVVAAGGLVGTIREVENRTAQGIDWTHSEFRASAMTADGAAYGIVEPRPGRFREEDLLTLTGAPFHSDIPPGTRIVTSGRGGLYPRGLPVGVVIGIDEADTGWRKSYILRPLVRPEGVSYVLVGRKPEGSEAWDVADIWYVPAPPDTAPRGDADSARARRND
ncbi:MAG TPA: rod shape-determining protein MreC [Longimicrobiales bacterium]